jgi:glycosyltransferase involved in cell wall biosynthesis
MTEMAAATTPGEQPAERSISVIVTALNEEGNLAPTVDAVVRAAAPRFPRYEVIVIDDGSSDRTAAIAQSLAAANPRIRLHRNPRNLGLGRSYRIGIDLASNTYTSWVAGNNMVPREALERIYDRVGERDMVISYVVRDVRGLRRRLMSRAFTIWMNLLFSVRMRYYTGPCVYRSALAKRLPMRAHGSLFVAELLVRLLRARQTYVEVGLQPLPRSSGATKTFRISNVLDVFASMMRLFWELRVSRHDGVPAPQVERAVANEEAAVRSRRRPTIRT